MGRAAQIVGLCPSAPGTPSPQGLTQYRSSKEKKTAFAATLGEIANPGIQTGQLFTSPILSTNGIAAKQQIPIRRILLKDDSAYSIRPSFLMPYMTARTADVEGPLFLRKFGVPFWALARVFGGDPMSWYRMECGLGRFSVVGTTVRTATLPEHLLADEHHQGLDGQK